MKFEELTQEEIDIIMEYCKVHEDEFREFVTGKVTLMTKSVNAEELAYEYCKPLIREQKISSLLNDE